MQKRIAKLIIVAEALRYTGPAVSIICFPTSFMLAWMISQLAQVVGVTRRLWVDHFSTQRPMQKRTAQLIIVVEALRYTDPPAD